MHTPTLVCLALLTALGFTPAQSEVGAGLGHLSGATQEPGKQDPAKKPADAGKAKPAGKEAGKPAGKEAGKDGADKDAEGKDAEGKETAAADDLWLTDYKEAQKRAKKEKKVILMDFTGSDWCGWCIKLKEEVFSKPEFEAWAAENVILLEVDFPRKTKLAPELAAQNEKLKQEFKPEGYPTIFFVTHDGKVVGQSGYMAGGPAAWTREADKFVKKAKKK
jgi:protein disulfide-isomerase